MVPFFNEAVFESRLTSAFQSNELACKMVRLHGAYQHAIGLTDTWEPYFNSPAEVVEFKKRHQTSKGFIYHPDLFERVLIAELALTAEQASLFTQIEEAYMIEIGIM